MKRIYKTRSVSEKTYRRLERAILRRELQPGAVLVINDLATELGVSRTPVKEALLLLENAGLVQNDNGRISVAKLSLGDLEEMFEVRQAIELFALDKLIDRGLNGQLTTLYDMLDAHRNPSGEGEARAALELDLKFHRGIVAATGNSRLLTIWDQIANELRRFWNDGVGNLSRIATEVDECLEILDALRDEDAERAKELLLGHLEQTKLSLASWQREQLVVAGS